MKYSNQYGETITIAQTDEVWLNDDFFAREMAKLPPDAPRAGLAYRVSTKGQVDHDDIPMQKIVLSAQYSSFAQTSQPQHPHSKPGNARPIPRHSSHFQNQCKIETTSRRYGICAVEVSVTRC